MADAPNPKYDPQSSYNKFHSCDCTDKDSCECDSNCDICCPVGTVGVLDECGNIVGCMSPNDAEHYNASQIRCAEGYVKVLHPETGEFMGCMTAADAVTILNTLAPPPVAPVSDFSVINPTLLALDSASGKYEITGGFNPGGTGDLSNIFIDRNGCTGDITVSLTQGNLPIPIQFGSTGGPVSTLTIPDGESTHPQFELDWADSAIPVGVYDFDLIFSGCGVTYTLPVQLTIS